MYVSFPGSLTSEMALEVKKDSGNLRGSRKPVYCDFSNSHSSSEGCLPVEEQVEVLWTGSFQNE